MSEPSAEVAVSGTGALLLVLSAIDAGVSRKRVYAALDAMWDVLERKR